MLGAVPLHEALSTCDADEICMQLCMVYISMGQWALDSKPD